MFKLEIETDNDAFQDGNLALELSCIFSKLVKDIQDEIDLNGAYFTLRDINGNRVGIARFEED